MKKRQNQEIIYEAALQQFAEYGYKKTTLDNIAEKLNMTNANLYSYATSKQALYHDCVAYALIKWQNKVIAAIEGVDNPRELLPLMCDSAVHYLSEDKTFCRILKLDPDIFPMFPTVDPYEEINQTSYNLLRNVLEKGVQSGDFIEMDIDKSAHIMFAVYKALIIETYIRNENDNFMDIYTSARNLLIHGVLKK